MALDSKKKAWTTLFLKQFWEAKSLCLTSFISSVSLQKKNFPFVCLLIVPPDTEGLNEKLVVRTEKVCSHLQ